jgi:hypothetical protein
MSGNLWSRSPPQRPIHRGGGRVGAKPAKAKAHISRMMVVEVVYPLSKGGGSSLGRYGQLVVG